MNLSEYLNSILVMTEREIKARYKSAILGFLWIFLNPLLQMFVIGFIFNNFINVPGGNYFRFLFTGLLPWNFFSYSLTKATPSIVYERTLIQKAKFPYETIPLSLVFSNFFNFMISMALFIVYLVLFCQNTFGSAIQFLYFIVAILWLLFFSIGICLLTSSLNTKYRDVNFFVKATITLWFYASPIVYSLSSLPEGLLPIFKLNPLSTPLELLRYSLLGVPNEIKQIVLPNLLITVLILLIGIIIFKKESKTFSDWL
jgi:ABC-2 type transport system permease protein